MQILSIRLRLIFQFRGENGFYVLYLYLNRVELSGGRCFLRLLNGYLWLNLWCFVFDGKEEF